MKNRDDIIAGLRGCIAGNCSNCDYGGRDCGRDRLMKDAADLIEQLTDDLKGAHDETHRLMKSLKVARAERDAAREKLARMTGEREAGWLSENGAREGM